MAFFNRVVCSSLCYKWGASSNLNPTSVRPFVSGKYVVRCHRDSNYSSLSTTMSRSDLMSKYMQVYDSIKYDLLHDPSCEFDDDSRQRIEWMIDYNVPGGKMFRALTVVESYQLLKREKLTDDEVFLACVLGWCNEWHLAYMQIHDDMMDGSHTRRGRSCWFRLPEVGMMAINDAVILRNHIAKILKKYFNRKAYYVNLLDLFNEVEFQTVHGQMLDGTTKLAGRENLLEYSMSTYHRVVQFKASYYLFYHPVACALLMAGENLDDNDQLKDIFCKMSTYFQIQDDYMDIFGDPNYLGSQAGSDIENGACTWLVVKALELGNEEQKKILCENYGTKDPTMVAKVEEIYHTLNLQSVFEDYRNKAHEELVKSIEALPSKPLQGALKSYWDKLYITKK